MSSKVMIVFALVLACNVIAEEETTRQLWDTQFVDPPKQAAPASKPAAPRRYRVATPEVAPASVSPETVVGISVWKLRRSISSDGARLLVQENDQTVEWTPQRVEANSTFSEGDRVRLSIEAARDGYLYVIDREKFADGTLGEPYLIFPTTRTSAGDNKISIGRPIEIPSQEDKPPHFTVRKSRPDQQGELLSILITPEPLKDVSIGSRPVVLSNDQVAEWERFYKKQSGHLELEGGAGMAWTKAEKEAGAGKAQLVKIDPRPQSIFYVNNTQPDDGVLINVELNYQKK